ncbi:MAG: Rnf-Nqr domain containing protein [Clostridia bacterium]|nr:Rnf-Nqr domain containing protein [Clostridia bacterium]
MKKTSYLLRGTPSILLVLGSGFVMASSADVRAALGMGFAVLLSLLLTSIVVSAIHKLIPSYAKLPAYLLIITGFVSLISMLMQAYFPEIVDMLGVHLAALAVSAVIFRDCEEVADHYGEGRSILTAIVTGFFLTVIMVVCALFRETLGNSSFCGQPIAFLENYKVSALAGAFGGYLVLAVVVAAVNKITGIHKSEEKAKKEDN